MPILPRGIYCPTLSFFNNDKNQSIDAKTSARHTLRLAKAGLTGVVLQGSTGEAIHLTREERKTFISESRKALNEAGYTNFKIIAGAGGQSFNETEDLLNDSFQAGADAGIVLTPGYYVDQMTPEALVDYYYALADISPIPILAYNFPGVTNGVNMSSSTLIKLAAHPRIIGCKLTCNDFGKMTYLSEYGGNLPAESKEFDVFAGSSDFLIAAHAAGVAGTITAMANQFPYTLVALWRAIESGDLHTSRRLQAIVTRAEGIANEGFIPTARALLRVSAGYGGKSRSPLYEVSDDSVFQWSQEIRHTENTLSRLASSKM